MRNYLENIKPNISIGRRDVLKLFGLIGLNELLGPINRISANVVTTGIIDEPETWIREGKIFIPEKYEGVLKKNEKDRLNEIVLLPFIPGRIVVHPLHKWVEFENRLVEVRNQRNSGFEKVVRFIFSEVEVCKYKDGILFIPENTLAEAGFSYSQKVYLECLENGLVLWS